MSTPDDVAAPLREALYAAERHAHEESDRGETDHARQWAALAYQLTGMIGRLNARSKVLDARV